LQPAASSQGARVVLLTNPLPHTMETARVLLDAGVNLVGVVSADETKLGIPFPQYLRALRRNGALTTFHKWLGAFVYGLINLNRNRRFYRKTYNRESVAIRLASAGVPILECTKYADERSIEWLRQLDPEILVVHSESWVPKRVRELASSGLVIGGHPGLTPTYRGGYSSFWALHHRRPEDVMWSVFHVDKGVDTGDLIAQGPVPYQPGDTFKIVDWRAMLCIAEAQARSILNYDRGIAVPRVPHERIPEGTLYGLPTLLDYLRFRRRQKAVR
jgi:hypothetical protein